MRSLIARKRTDLPDRLEALDRAVELADGRLSPDSVDNARRLTSKARERLRHGTANTLIALVGATGSGKSSVTNLIVGDDVATAGVRRPTTSSTLACVFGDDDVEGLLDWLDIASRHRVAADSEGLDGMILLDVPDFDSIEQAHREEMERIAERVDVLVWVTDPEKYADNAMHTYLSNLAGHGAVMAVALNKVDLISPDEAAACEADMKRLLSEAGLQNTPTLALSALKGDGRQSLVDFLENSVSSKNAAVERLAADTDDIVGALAAELGEAKGPETVPESVGRQLVEDLLSMSGLSTVTDAVAAGYRRDASKRAGWPFTRWALKLRPHPLRRLHLGRSSTGASSLPAPSGIQRARIGGALRTTADSVSEQLPDPWPSHILAAGSPDDAVLADQVDQAVATAVRETNSNDPRWWSVADVTQTAIALTAIAGGIWLALIAAVAYLQMPNLPIPHLPEPLDAFPVPTTMLLGGLLLGLILTIVFRRIARVGANRRARAVRKQAGQAIDTVAQDLVIDPIDQELLRYRQLDRAIQEAKAH